VSAGFHENEEISMRVKIPVAVLLLALLVAYVLGTESGRAQRNAIMAKLGRAPEQGATSGAAQAA
jgi:hypothetical protein